MPKNDRADQPEELDRRTTTPRSFHPSTETLPISSQGEPATQVHTTVYEPQLPQSQTEPSIDDQGRTSPWLALAMLGVAVIALLFRFIGLADFQSEMYGDIVIVHDYVMKILGGARPSGFVLSAGPLYHYLIAPLIAWFGPTYYSYKLASVLVSCGVLLSTYLLAKQLLNQQFALLAVLIASVSSWLLIFSRLGNSQILVPLLTTLSLYLLVCVIQGKGWFSEVACGIVAALGLYVYPQSFVIIPSILLTLLCLRWIGWKISWDSLFTVSLAAIMGAIPIVRIILQDPANFFSGYIGGKLESDISPFFKFLQNIWYGTRALWLAGDTNFRSNPHGVAHLDLLSGIFVILGAIFWLNPSRRKYAPIIFIPLFCLQLPSWLVLSGTNEVPSASRTLGVAPILYILVASGLYWLWQIRARWLPTWLMPTLVGIIVLAIISLNSERYFSRYLSALPYNNTPISTLTANFINSIPVTQTIVLIDCCWEDSMPEPAAIKALLQAPTRFEHVESRNLNCDWLAQQEQQSVLIWSHNEELPDPILAPCAHWIVPQIYTSPKGLPIFQAAVLRSDSQLRDVPIERPPLERALVSVQGRMAQAQYSQIDIGSIGDIFDGDGKTLMRGAEANPFEIHLSFAEAMPISQIDLGLGTMPGTNITITITDTESIGHTWQQHYAELQGDLTVNLIPPDGQTQAQELTILIFQEGPRPSAGFHIHIRELTLLP